ncbi:MAG: hypothetical protein AAB263_11255 [Planctomycetota bacterium]
MNYFSRDPVVHRHGHRRCYERQTRTKLRQRIDRLALGVDANYARRSASRQRVNRIGVTVRSLTAALVQPGHWSLSQ